MESMIDMGLVEKVGVVGICVAVSYMIVKHICSYLKIEKEPVTVLLTAAAGEIGYALAPGIVQGAAVGKDQPVILHLLDTEAAARALDAVRMELLDSAFPLLQGVMATTDVGEACKGVDIAIMLDEFPQEKGMGRKDEVIAKNVALYKAYASALNKHAADDCKVLVAGNPANTNALILKDFAPSIQAKNITCLTRLDHNRALGRVSEKLGVHVSSVKNVVIWGNHTSTPYPDANHAVVATNNGQKHILDLTASDPHWLYGEFIAVVQQRSMAVIKARKLTSAISAAKAICDHIHDWIHATPKGTWVSMGVFSDGSYGIEPEIFYSFPVTCQNGEWSIVQGIKINEFSRRKMDETMKELAREREVAYACLTNQREL